MLPDYDQIHEWIDEKIKFVITSGESLNWDIGNGEDEAEIDYYIQTVYAEAARRKINY